LEPASSSDRQKDIHQKKLRNTQLAARKIAGGGGGGGDCVNTQQVLVSGDRQVYAPGRAEEKQRMPNEI